MDNFPHIHLTNGESEWNLEMFSIADCVNKDVINMSTSNDLPYFELTKDRTNTSITN